MKNIHKGFVSVTFIIIITGVFILTGISEIGIKYYQGYSIEKINVKQREQEQLYKLESEIKNLKNLNEEKDQQIKKIEKNQVDIESKQKELSHKPYIPISVTQNYSTSEVVNRNKKYIVYVLCNTSNNTFVSGSGIIIGKDGSDILILTNHHVIEDAYTSNKTFPPCIIEDSFGGFYYVQSIYYPGLISQEEMKLKDFALLKIFKPVEVSQNFIYDPETETFSKNTNPSPPEQNLKLLSLNTFPEICTINSLSTGSNIVVMGYPSVGGSNFLGEQIPRFTITEGVISSEVTNLDHYFTSSAKIEHGNSGGGAFLNVTGCLAGMPTFVTIGSIESLGRLINLPKLKADYLSKII